MHQENEDSGLSMNRIFGVKFILLLKASIQKLQLLSVKNLKRDKNLKS